MHVASVLRATMSRMDVEATAEPTQTDTPEQPCLLETRDPSVWAACVPFSDKATCIYLSSDVTIFGREVKRDDGQGQHNRVSMLRIVDPSMHISAKHCSIVRGAGNCAELVNYGKNGTTVCSKGLMIRLNCKVFPLALLCAGPGCI